MILGLEHSSANKSAYQEKDGTFVAILKYPTKALVNLKIYFDDPYNWKIVDQKNKTLKWICRHNQKPESIESDGVFDYATFKLNSKEKRFKYFFQFEYQQELYAYGEVNLMKWKDLAVFDYHSFAFTWNYSSPGKYIGTPKWWKETNWYQIFPDSFAHHQKILTNAKNEDVKKLRGGSLLGIIDKLDYLVDLGFNGIYLNPIFKANSNHKYDTVDYFSIDSDFGSLNDFKKLISEAKKRNIKIMLDGVFNHVGANHPYWLDVVKNGCNSPYFDWFIIWDETNLKLANQYQGSKFVNNKPYSTFGHTPYMPRLNWEHLSVSEYILKVIEFWTNLGVDAWRMDVADEVSFRMWQKVKALVQKINSQIVLLGEIWYDATPFLHGDQFDSTMNYPFRSNIIALLNNQKSVRDFVNQLITNKYRYSQEINKGLFNLVGSHDVKRIAQALNHDLAKARLAIAFLLLSYGVVSFYYGDEIDLDSSEENFYRGIFNWNKKPGKTFELVKNLLSYRRANLESLQNQKVKFLSNDSFILELSNNQQIIFEINKPKLIIKKQAKEIFSLIL